MELRTRKIKEKPIANGIRDKEAEKYKFYIAEESKS